MVSFLFTVGSILVAALFIRIELEKVVEAKFPGRSFGS